MFALRHCTFNDTGGIGLLNEGIRDAIRLKAVSSEQG